MPKEEKRSCQNCHGEFLIDASDFEFYSKIKVPPPTFCPECRFQRRLAWVNLRTLYKRPDIFDSKKALISMYAPDKPHVIWEDKKWWSDDFNPFSYGREYDFSAPFFAQFGELLKNVPLPHLQRDYATGVNSEYCNGFSQLKNCYLAFAADSTEDSFYAYTVENLKDCCDITFSTRNELCYEVMNVRDSNHILFSHDCESCYDIMFCRDCTGCNNCFGCANLTNKKYYIFNEPYSKEDYEKKIQEFKIGSYEALSGLHKQVSGHFVKYPYRAFHGRRNKDARGDYVYNSKNAHDVYIVDGCEDVKHGHFLRSLGGVSGITSSHDYSIFGVNADLMYEAAWCGLGCSNVKCSLWNYGSRNLDYCIGCHNSSDLFGCIGVRKGQYCIFNKQYTKDEYGELREKIIQQMKNIQYKDSKARTYSYGDFFPIELSPFGYNETVAYNFSQRLSEKDAKSLGYNWEVFESGKHGESSYAIPDSIGDVRDDIVDAVIACIACEKNYRLIEPELNLYRRLGVPVPRKCHECRFRERIGQLTPRKLFERSCAKCQANILTGFSPERPEIVYCEACYNSEVA